MSCIWERKGLERKGVRKGEIRKEKRSSIGYGTHSKKKTRLTPPTPHPNHRVDLSFYSISLTYPYFIRTFLYKLYYWLGRNNRNVDRTAEESDHEEEEEEGWIIIRSHHQSFLFILVSFLIYTVAVALRCFRGCCCFWKVTILFLWQCWSRILSSEEVKQKKWSNSG